jgi:outer membrane protein assembly complex protein YaeT
MGTFLLAALLAAAGAPEERVRSVHVDAPAADRARLTRYVEIAPGDVLDADRVRRAVELIHATGAYADVRVEMERGPDGVDLVFRPVLAPLLTDVRVDGDSRIDGHGVREAARLRAREPLWPPRLDAAAQAVALRLGGDGYPEALVTAEAVSDGHGGATALFHVHAGPRVHVTRTQVVGAPGTVVARPAVGDVWRRASVRESVQALRRQLATSGYWRADVYADETYDPAAAGVTVVFRVDRGPAMDMEVRGAALPGALREEVLRLLRDGAARSDSLDEAADHIEESLRREGHREARVSAKEEPARAGLKIVFDVAAGPMTVVDSIRVVGDVVPSGVTLLTRVGEPVRDRDVDEDVRLLTRALQEEGHADARVDVEAPERAGAIPVVLVVRAGPRTEIGSVDVASPVELDVAPVRELRLKSGRPYRPRDLVADRNTVLAAYRNAGYLQADVVPRLQFSPDRGRLDVHLDVIPGPRTRIAHIVVAGLDATREDVVRRELPFQEGDPLGLEAVLDGQRRLGALGVFGNVSISEVDPESVETRSLIVRVEELPRISLAYGLGYSERDGPRLSAEVTRRNLGGQNRSLTTFVRGSFKSLRFFTTYRQPYLFGRRQEFFVTGFREEEERDTFDFVRYGLTFEAARRVTSSWSVIARYSTQETRSFNLRVAQEEIDKQYLTATFSGPSLSLVHDSRDDPLDPRRGAFVTGDAQLSHRVLGGESFVKGYLQGSVYRRLAARVVLAGNGRLGLARTLDSDEPDRLPLPDRFFAGGDYSLRGFAQDRVGPLEPSTTPGADPVPTGGNALVLGSTELRVGLTRYLGVATFAEAGQVYPLVANLDLHDVRYAAGLGLRYRTAFGPLRADWGYKLNRRPGEKPSHFHLTIGHAF